MKKLLFLLCFISTNILLAQKPAATLNTEFKGKEGTSNALYNITEIKTAMGLPATVGTVTNVTSTVPTGLSVAIATPTTTPAIAITNNMPAGVVKSAGIGGALSTSAVNLATEVTGLLPNANLQNSLINHTVANAGTAIGFTTASTALGATQTLNVPLAAPTVTSGAVSNSTQTFAGLKTYSGGTVQVGTTTTKAITIDGTASYAQVVIATGTTVLNTTNNEINFNLTAAGQATLPPCTATALGNKYTFTRIDASNVFNATIATTAPDVFVGGGATRTIFGVNNQLECTCQIVGIYKITY